MASLPCSDPPPLRLDLDPSFQPSETVHGDELYPNGIFEFNITRLSAYIVAAGRFRAEPVALEDICYGGTSPGLNELTIAAADLSRPVILAEISPGRYNLIDGNHRVAKARREGVPSILAYRIRCPEHVAFLTSTRAYEKYVEYWNSKVDDAAGVTVRRRRSNSSQP
ncbi:MAG: ParB/Srx family N-terminal domain-containing protein [Steroidobacteraceae bacterium]